MSLQSSPPGWFRSLRDRASGLNHEVFALYFAYRDPRTPWFAKAFTALVVGYAFSPIDLIPDFIPVLGFLDDLILVPLGAVLAIKMIPAAVMQDSRARAVEHLKEKRPANWFFAVLIVLVWAGAAFGLFWLLRPLFFSSSR